MRTNDSQTNSKVKTQKGKNERQKLCMFHYFMLINSNLAKTLNTEKKDNFESNTLGRHIDIISTKERFIL